MPLLNFREFGKYDETLVPHPCRCPSIHWNVHAYTIYTYEEGQRNQDDGCHLYFCVPWHVHTYVPVYWNEYSVFFQFTNRALIIGPVIRCPLNQSRSRSTSWRTVFRNFFWTVHASISHIFLQNWEGGRENIWAPTSSFSSTNSHRSFWNVRFSIMFRHHHFADIVKITIVPSPWHL